MDKIENVIIETSSVCNLRCIMCPTLSFHGQNGIMKDSVFGKIINDLHAVSSINLEGWGEPLMDKKIADRVMLAKTKAGQVSFTSNGTLLDLRLICDLKKSGLEEINISFDGGSKEIYERVRIGADFDHVVQNIRHLRTHDIKVSMTFVITTLNYDDIYRFIELASHLDVFKITLKPIDVVTTKNNLKIKPSSKKIIELYHNVRKYMAQNHIDIPLHAWNILENSRPKDNCLANPLNVLFINHLGEISPCCNLGHPAPRLHKTVFRHRKIENTFFSFGNITKQNIYDIWNKPEYVTFRNQIRNKIRPNACRFCNLF